MGIGKRRGRAVQELCRQNFTASKVGRSTQGKTREEPRMILDDNFAGLIMLGLLGLMTFCYQFGKFIGQYNYEEQKKRSKQ
jgi:hypothetical protein